MFFNCVSKYKFWSVNSSLFMTLKMTPHLHIQKPHTYTPCPNSLCILMLSHFLSRCHTLTYTHIFKDSTVSLLGPSFWEILKVGLLCLAQISDEVFSVQKCCLLGWAGCGLYSCVCAVVSLLSRKACSFFCQFPPGGNVKWANFDWQVVSVHTAHLEDYI